MPIGFLEKYADSIFDIHVFPVLWQEEWERGTLELEFRPTVVCMSEKSQFKL